MAVADVFDIENKKVAQVDLNDAVFGAEVNEAIIYDVVKMQLASRRSGTASTKTRSDVSGGGKKPWRQKGTGRARAGSSRSPIWRSGGTVFGPHPRDYSYSVPKKVRKKALISALSLKFKENKMLILKDFPMEKISTRVFKNVVDLFSLKKALFVLADNNEVLLKSSRNIKNIKMIRSEGINVYDILNHEHLILLEPSVKKIEGALLA
ncbi:50S ribosomal protein L4 [Smithella sp. SC_K08D17]|jgi:large subunit ribosomal protein L4|nr:50S ribosomal protein L4 [Smithella sp. SCADC]KFZ44295.1 50S ribosomal protein L4 [Smithella sp. D17]KIE17450.1 50S ribosomal protein L4 [Smithella sp. SC_K08D17]MDD5344281.1 50S ribosomal protein L4 [Smithella sp.]PKN37628.1 MAG: 50S ribosomal protein L4 [Deltaproteobacteria bacterium HGW-Deltaproteobacteria-2]PKN66261.1 MAG: 50S ribosomal protein L4 [Deltaproteobacteria bacterium HGW-Deltaproteobacteria-10]